MSKKLSVSNLLGIKYLNENDINLIFETANNFSEVINRKIKKRFLLLARERKCRICA